MKKLILLILFNLTSLISSASHLAGGEIWYQYAGDTAHPYRYDIYLIVYRDVSGVSMCPGYCPATICIESNCFTDQQVVANLLPFNLRPGSDTIAGSYSGSIKTPQLGKCVSSNSTNMVYTELYRFYAQVDLPGPCSDYSFSYSANARNSSNNLLNPYSENFNLRATLDNTAGPNSSPVFQTPAIKAFCLGTTFNWSHFSIDKDGDSLYYTLEIPYGGSCNNPTLLTYQNGYHQSSPITSSTPVHFDFSTGTITFTPSQIENVTFKIDVTEFRTDPIYGIRRVGSTTRDVQVPIVSSNDCGVSSGTWLTNANTPTGGGMPEFYCGDSILKIKFTDQIINASIASDGSDFALLNSHGNLVPIIGATPSTPYNKNLYSYSIDLKLHQPISYNDTLYLYIRKGSDLNTLLTSCGYEVTSGDSLYLKVSDCQTSIGLPKNFIPTISLYPNPANESITLTSDHKLTGSNVTVLDITGRPIIMKTLTSEMPKISISLLPAGIYSIRISNNKWVQTIQFEKL